MHVSPSFWAWLVNMENHAYNLNEKGKCRGGLCGD